MALHSAAADRGGGDGREDPLVLGPSENEVQGAPGIDGAQGIPDARLLNGDCGCLRSRLCGSAKMHCA